MDYLHITDVPRKETTREQVEAWLSTAQPGDTITYKIGPQLVFSGGRLGSVKVSSGVIAIREMYDRGEVILFQRRLTAPGRRASDSMFAYTAIRRKTDAAIPREFMFVRAGLTDSTLIGEAA